MATTVTVTGVAGPAQAVTAAVFTNISTFTVFSNTNILEMTDNHGKITQVSVNAATTVTATKSGNVWTLTIS